jgi:HSP20 family protein
MFNLTPWRKNQPQQRSTTGGALAPAGFFDPINRLREEFDHLFEQFFTGWPTLANGGRWNLDVQDQDDAIVVRAEPPGFEPDDFDLQVHGNQLVLRAHKQAAKEEKERGYREWQQQEFYRSVPLPEGIDTDRVDARYRNGILTVTLPKTEQTKGKRIQVSG